VIQLVLKDLSKTRHREQDGAHKRVAFPQAGARQAAVSSHSLKKKRQSLRSEAIGAGKKPLNQSAARAFY
jgi:hypothetical protein